MTNYQRSSFLALSFFAGTLEIGSIVGPVRAEWPTLWVFLVAAAYQFGALIGTKQLSRRNEIGVFFAVCTATLMVAMFRSRYGILLLVFSASMLLNAQRAGLGKAEISTSLKRSFRVGGFLAAGLLSSVATAVVVAAFAASVSFAVFLDRSMVSVPDGTIEDPAPMNRRMALILVLHQTHYFSYYPVVLLAFLVRFGIKLGVLVFLVGWVSYIATPHLIPRGDPWLVGIVGHCLLSVALVALWRTPIESWRWIALWTLTGFFGGTVVFLTRFAKQTCQMTEQQLAVVESFGHCVGISIAVLAVSLGFVQRNLVLVAALFAALTAGGLVTVRSNTGEMRWSETLL
jgi:hypothetical protein